MIPPGKRNWIAEQRLKYLERYREKNLLNLNINQDSNQSENKGKSKFNAAKAYMKDYLIFQLENLFQNEFGEAHFDLRTLSHLELIEEYNNQKRRYKIKFNKDYVEIDYKKKKNNESLFSSKIKKFLFR